MKAPNKTESKLIVELEQAKTNSWCAESKYQHLFNSLGDAIFIHDMTGQILDVNDQACRRYGYSYEKFIMMQVKDVDTSEQAKNFEKRLQLLLENGSITFETIHLDSQKRQIPTEATAKLGKYDGQQVVLVIGHDITERKRAEKMLKTNEQRLQLAIEGADLGMWDWDIKTGNIYFSHRYLSMLGYGPIELPHNVSTWENLLHPDNKESAMQQIMASIESGSGQWDIEFRLKAKDGKYIWISGRGKVVEFSQDGSPIRAAGTHRDITNRKIAEEELRDKVKELNEALTQIKTLKGIIPICMHCKGIRDGKGSWNQLEKYITEHSDAQFSHGICEKCLKEHFPDCAK